MRHKVKRWLMAAFVVLTLYLGFGDSVGESPFWHQVDKGMHFMLFGIFSFLFVLFAQQNLLLKLPGLARWTVLAMLLTSVCVGGELIHLFVPGRTFEWGDIFANFLGSAVFTAVAALLVAPKDFSTECKDYFVDQEFQLTTSSPSATSDPGQSNSTDFYPSSATE